LRPFWSWRPQRQRRAIFTVVRDEAVFLPIWLRYYSRHFLPEQIFVFDHGTSDGSVDAARARFRFRHTRVDHPAYNDFPWYTDFVQQRQRDLLTTHDVVVFAEADEILWHPSGLHRYLDAFTRDAIRTTGWNLWHDRREEPDLDLRRGILRQRRYWVRNTEYDKALVTRVGLSYGYGFHVCHECDVVDGDLLLLHLHTMDFRVALQKHERTRAYRDYSTDSLAHGFGFQGRFVGDEFAAWFDAQGGEGRRQPIPRHLLRARPV
jgi:hypothetical protein